MRCVGFAPHGLESSRAPEDLIRFWLGHAKSSVTDGYSKLDEDVEFRLDVANNVGTGFVVPELAIPMRLKKAEQKRMEVAA